MGYNAQVKHSLIIHLKQLNETRTLLKSKCTGMAAYLNDPEGSFRLSCIQMPSPHVALSHMMNVYTGRIPGTPVSLTLGVALGWFQHSRRT